MRIVTTIGAVVCIALALCWKLLPAHAGLESAAALQEGCPPSTSPYLHADANVKGALTYCEAGDAATGTAAERWTPVALDIPDPWERTNLTATLQDRGVQRAQWAGLRLVPLKQGAHADRGVAIRAAVPAWPSCWPCDC